MTASKELYKFVQGENEWFFTSADTEETYDGDLYIPTTLERDETETRNELSKANLNVTFDINNAFARIWLSNYSDYVLSLTVFEKTDTATNVIFKGRFISNQPSGSSIKMRFENIFTSLRRSGVRAKYQKTCRHALYNRGCNLNSEDFALPSAVTGVDDTGTVFTVPNAALEPDGYYLGGMMRAPDNTLRLIIDHQGDTLTVQSAFLTLKEEIVGSGYGLNYGNFYGGVAIKIYPGCDHLRATCLDKFDNLDNYGGFPWIPSRNPMDGSSIV